MSSRSQPLDLLRAVAVLLVLGRHREMSAVWMHVGWVGVDLFFVLSGYLVSSLLYREQLSTGAVDGARFLVRRGFKIYPSFWVLIAASCAFQIAKGDGFEAKRLLAELLFFQNYAGGLWTHTWSLAVEEHFYLLLAAGVLLATRASPTFLASGRFRALLIGIIGVVVAGRVVSAVLLPHDLVHHFMATHARIDGLVFGALLGHLRSYSPQTLQHFVSRFRLALLSLGAAAVAVPLLFPFEHPFLYTAGYSLLYLGFGALLLVAVDTAALRASTPLLKAFARVGRHSYTIYLWHMPLVPVFEIAARKLPVLQQPLVGAVSYIAASIAVGIAAALFVEEPLLSLRDRLVPAKASALPAAS